MTAASVTVLLIIFYHGQIMSVQILSKMSSVKPWEHSD
jgi:hypothetical protein